VSRIVRIRMSEKTFALFDDYRIGLSIFGGARFKPGDPLRLSPDCRVEEYANFTTGNMLPVELGAFTYNNSPYIECARIGRYCSLAGGISLMGNDHPTDKITSSPIGYRVSLPSFRRYLEDRGITPAFSPFREKEKELTIGHDVWIGSGALLARGITLGHGCIVAARSVVTKDVPPYAVVGGIPGRVIRKRFDEATCAALLASKWWEHEPTIVHDVMSAPGATLRDKLARVMDRAGSTPFAPRVLTGEEIVASGTLLS